jgi:hypothetical protein
MINVIGMLFFSIINIIWSVIFIIPAFFKYKLYIIKGTKIKHINTEIKYASIWEHEEPTHWIVGKYFIGYIHTLVHNNGGTSNNLYLLCSTKFYDKIINKKSEDKKNLIIFYEREGHYWNLKYTSRPIECDLKPFGKQKKIINEINQDYNKNGFSICLLHGEAGKGKSMISLLLANTFLKQNKNVSVIDSFNPTEPGDTFISMYNNINPTKDNPLILVMEEIDIIIENITLNKIQAHKYLPIQIKSKIDWNMFLDRFDRNLYKNIIIIFTTNKSKSYFDNLDKSYFRKGRISLEFNL